MALKICHLVIQAVPHVAGSVRCIDIAMGRRQIGKFFSLRDQVGSLPWHPGRMSGAYVSRGSCRVFMEEACSTHTGRQEAWRHSSGELRRPQRPDVALRTGRAITKTFCSGGKGAHQQWWEACNHMSKTALTAYQQALILGWHFCPVSQRSELGAQSSHLKNLKRSQATPVGTCLFSRGVGVSGTPQTLEGGNSGIPLNLMGEMSGIPQKLERDTSGISLTLKGEASGKPLILDLEMSDIPLKESRLKLAGRESQGAQYVSKEIGRQLRMMSSRGRPATGQAFNGRPSRGELPGPNGGAPIRVVGGKSVHRAFSGAPGSGEGTSGPPGTADSAAQKEVEVQRVLLEAYRLLDAEMLPDAELLLREVLLEGSVLDPREGAVVWDQCALLAYLRGAHQEAESAALRCLDLLQQSKRDPAGEDLARDPAGYPDGGLEAAEGMARLRLGAALCGRQKWAEARPLLSAALAVVGAAGPRMECLYLMHVADLAAHPQSSTSQTTFQGIVQALEGLRKSDGLCKLLVKASLRELHRVVDSYVELQDYSSAELLYSLEVRVLETIGAQAEAISLATYQVATFLYARGSPERALPLALQSLLSAQQAFKPLHDQIALREHRKATILVALGAVGGGAAPLGCLP
eukprot:jgi/Botrbrau1/5257/Bobra.0172s0116.1